jgi:hypothetical protein
MDLNTEYMSIIGNVVLVPSLAYATMKIKQFAPQIEKMSASIVMLGGVIAQIKDIYQTFETDTADGTLSPEKSAEIIAKVKTVCESKDVRALMEEFAV